jgi:hypothetical protein
MFIFTLSHNVQVLKCCATLLCILNEIANRLTRDGSVQGFVGPEPFLGGFRQNIGRKIKCWMEHQHLVLFCVPCCTQRQAWELTSGPDLATRAQLLSFIRTRSRVVIGLLTGHNTLRRHLYIMGLSNSPTCRKCGMGRKPQSTFCVSVRPSLWSSGQSFWLRIQRSWVRSPVLPDFLSNSGSGTGSTQPREPRGVNWGATWIKEVAAPGLENRD